ncbi:hypothetical protein H2203_000987 [Taxawa tesnikishii (nom. ined.)]|nr:hypothetical protein H2203_000987 [Dothideales sp. JES 119]
MTRAQFEQAQRLREQTAAADDEKSEDSEGSGGEFDDEDEAERQRNIAKQRRKQEATMAVYRQQMKKVTGGQPSDLPNPGGRPGLDRASYSAPGLASSTSSMHLGGATVTDAAAEAEEDEDVPLGILQAHGFPNKTRPPNKVGEVPGSPGARQMSAGYTGSVVGDMGGSLPPFARKLPMDPYFGASLVNPANRESLAFANSGGSVYGAPASAPPPPMHPGGLVGVIAGEERARAARRGSPNPITGTYGMPLPTNMQMPQLPRASSMGTLMQPQMGMGMLGMGQMGMGMGMGMGMQPMMSPSEQAQMQQNAQMAQLMQMQTQMMQQMMAMQQGQMPQMQLPMQQQFQQQQQQMGMGMAMNNGFLNTPNAGMRPLSTISQAPSQANAGRTMSMMNPPQQWDQQTPHQRANTMGSNLNPPGYAGSIYDMHLGAPITPAGYTPSIAPSERSNIGMPSRYRPVSTLNDDARSVVMGANPTARTQTMTSQSAAQAFARQQGSLLAPPSPNTANKAKNTIRVVDKPKGTPRMSSRQASAGAEEDDDEEGWMEMKKKREEMRKRRAGGKENVQSTEDSLGELYQAYE